ncbi:MAG: glycoside hydrolase family 13 [Ferruginibacter sp.]
MTTTKVSFKLPASYVAGASHGILLGEFNNWNTEEGIYLEKTEDGSLVAELTLTAGQTYQYRYLLSDGRWVNDDSNKAFSELYGYTVENCIVEVPVPVKKAAPKKATTPKAKTVKKAKDVQPDDLTKIEGIGKKVTALLKENNILSFKDLGKSSIKKLQQILDEGGSKFNLHNPASWPKQAKLAAAGKWEELETLQKELVGGK